VTRNSYSNYFVVGKNNNNMKLEGEQASFLYSPDWTGRFEVWPTKNNVMSAEPIGTQPGLGAMGFCYIPYKFVYDMYFPVLVQVYNPSNAEDVFQFAYAVVISKNAAREAMQSPEYSPPEESMCEKANQEITVNTYGSNLEAVEADIEIKCLNDACSLGRTEFDNSTGIASLKVMAPQCLNSIITASSAGYKDTTEIISTNTEAFVDIVMEKENTLGLEIYVDGNLINSDMSLLSINEMSNNLSFPSQTIAYPFKKEISLGEGDYNFDLKVFKNGNILVPSTTTRQCVKVPQTGVLGFFGLEDEKCTDITIPAQTLNNVLYAGGTLNQYITRSELQNARTMKVFAQSITLPSSAEEIGSNYDEIAGKTIYLELV